MALTVLWTKTAKETYLYTLEYLNEFWGLKHVNNFINRTEKILKLISNNPLIFKSVLENSSVRKGILHQNCSFLYRVIEDRIELLVFWDTRQEPFL
ncbi:hypothetical protein [Pedobacter frigiditerrae]|uniref:type II toxin-antitoxin system RelE/ParE family toxin n=1 Tax=Pedobacter frigiditerrae TaxID=2530452 RepID=UPI00292DEB5F|nr:hypothetical protein [Pedobacter frigiditerrae]